MNALTAAVAAHSRAARTAAAPMGSLPAKPEEAHR